MEKLTLEHLSPYLPHGLRVYNIYTGCITEMVAISSFYTQEKKTSLNGAQCILNVLYSNVEKPIMRPLSDMLIAKIVESYGEMVTFCDYIDGDFDLGALKWVLPEVAKGRQIERLTDLPYCVWKELLKHKFDVFDLIAKDLAVDINTLEGGR